MVDSLENIGNKKKIVQKKVVGGMAEADLGERCKPQFIKLPITTVINVLIVDNY